MRPPVFSHLLPSIHPRHKAPPLVAIVHPIGPCRLECLSTSGGRARDHRPDNASFPLSRPQCLMGRNQEPQRSVARLMPAMRSDTLMQTFENWNIERQVFFKRKKKTPKKSTKCYNNVQGLNCVQRVTGMWMSYEGWAECHKSRKWGVKFPTKRCKMSSRHLTNDNSNNFTLRYDAQVGRNTRAACTRQGEVAPTFSPRNLERSLLTVLKCWQWCGTALLRDKNSTIILFP